MKMILPHSKLAEQKKTFCAAAIVRDFLWAIETNAYEIPLMRLQKLNMMAMIFMGDGLKLLCILANTMM